MAPKRKASGDKVKKKKNVEDLCLSDVMCPICLSIMIEPVLMPCNHMLCLPCFNETVDQTSLQCPLCRKR